MSEVRCSDYGQLDGGELLDLLREAFGNPREEAWRRPVVRSAWDGHPANLLVEMPEGHWLPYAPWMDKHFEIRLDQFMCDTDPEDLKGTNPE